MSSSPTSRTLAECRKRGYLACVVEKWIPQTKRRLDVFGFGDVLAVDPATKSTLLIQATSTANMSARVKKIMTECEESARTWLSPSSNFIEVWGWAKRGPAGKRKLWTLRRVALFSDGERIRQCEVNQ